MFGEELVGEAVHLDQSLQLHDACGVEQFVTQGFITFVTNM